MGIAAYSSELTSSDKCSHYAASHSVSAGIPATVSQCLQCLVPRLQLARSA